MTEEERKQRHRDAVRRYRERNIELCRKRAREYSRLRRNNNPEYVEYQREWHKSEKARERRLITRKTPEQRAKETAYTRKIRQENPERRRKDNIRRAVNKAIKQGKIIPPKYCEICGKDPGLRPNGRRMLRADHYLGYDKEHTFDIQWVCPSCDGKLEIERGNTTLGKRKKYDE